MSLLSYKSAILAVKDKIDEMVESSSIKAGNQTENKEKQKQEQKEQEIIFNQTKNPEKLTDIMDVEFLMHKDATTVIIMYDKPLPGIIDHITYDPKKRDLYFIFDNAQVIVLGDKIEDNLHKSIINVKNAVLVYMYNKEEIYDMSTSKFIVSDVMI